MSTNPTGEWSQPGSGSRSTPPPELSPASETSPVRPPREQRPASRRSALGTAGVPIGRLFGVQIWLDWSLAIIFGLIAFDLGFGLFPRWHPSWSLGMVWAVAVGAAALFLASVLAHELAHALVARARGLSVPRITLFVFGGLAEMESEPSSPGNELLIAIVGPLTSIAIGVLSLLAVGWLAAPVQDLYGNAVSRPELLVAGLGPAATLLLWLGPINLMLGVFNLVPGFPLDGGRVLRALFWWGTGNLGKATRWAAFGGSLVAYGLMALGVLDMLGGAFAQGVWLVLIGWFLNNAAHTSVWQQRLSQALSGVDVGRVMRTRLIRVQPEMRVDDLVREMLWNAGDQRAFPVESEGRLIGLVCLSDVRKVPQERWPQTTVRDVLTPLEDLITLQEGASAQRALDELARRDVDQIPVVTGTPPRQVLLGVVRRSDVLRWVALQTGRA